MFRLFSSIFLVVGCGVVGCGAGSKSVLKAGDVISCRPANDEVAAAGEGFKTGSIVASVSSHYAVHASVQGKKLKMLTARSPHTCWIIHAHTATNDIALARQERLGDERAQDACTDISERDIYNLRAMLMALPEQTVAQARTFSFPLYERGGVRMENQGIEIAQLDQADPLLLLTETFPEVLAAFNALPFDWQKPTRSRVDGGLMFSLSGIAINDQVSEK